jgi:hypothetical protein
MHEGAANWASFIEGNNEDAEKRRLGDAAVEPHRIKFKHFERR